MIKAIFASDLAGGFGKDGSLPWPSISEDFKHFKETTLGSTIVMGRKTWDSIPQLHKRIPVVVTNKSIEDVKTVRPENLYNWLLENNDENIFIIGGTSLLTPDLLDLCGEIYHTTVKGVYDADVSLHPDTMLYLSQKSKETLLDTEKCIIRRLY